MRIAAPLLAALAVLALTAAGCEKKSADQTGTTTSDDAAPETAPSETTETTAPPSDDDDVTAAPPAEPPEDPTVHAEALWRQLTEESYTSWPLFPGTNEMYPGTRPHGAILTTRVNDTARGALEAGTRPLPEGSILVKLNHDMDKQLQAITVMEKRGEWFWMKRLPDGTLAEAGAVEGCIGCHQHGNDFIRTGE